MADKQVSNVKVRHDWAPTLLDHLCKLTIDTPASEVKLTSIVATIGPSSDNVDTLETMIYAGMNVARINFSHGSYDELRISMKNVRAAEKKIRKSTGIWRPVAIAMDIQGPQIRIGTLEGGPKSKVKLEKGKKVRITTDEKFADKSTADNLYINYKNITKQIKEGYRIFIDYGLISLMVQKVEPTSIICEVENGGTLGSHKEVNLPGVEIDLPSLSEKDKKDIAFGVEIGVEMIYASFIRSAQAISDIKNVLGEAGKDIFIVAKIENQQGIENLDEIIEAADGIMVARGDLGIEIAPEKVFLAQKSIIAKCNLAGKSVICARQMLESMINKPRPTRAETTDVANAVLDGVDCVMLSPETASGEYPVQCVETMARICREAESVIWHKQLFTDLVSKIQPPIDSDHCSAIAAVKANQKVLAAAIIIPDDGRVPKLISKYRPKCPIIAISRNVHAARQLHMFRGIKPVYYDGPVQEDSQHDVESRIKLGIKYGFDREFYTIGDPLIIVGKWKSTNALAIYKCPTNIDDFNIVFREPVPATAA